MHAGNADKMGAFDWSMESLVPAIGEHKGTEITTLAPKPPHFLPLVRRLFVPSPITRLCSTEAKVKARELLLDIIAAGVP
jgi:hypothetical protein